MTVPRLTVFFVLAVLNVRGWAQIKAVPGDQRASDRDAIREHIDQIFEAYIRDDRAAIQATHSTEWRGYISTSRRIPGQPRKRMLPSGRSDASAARGADCGSRHSTVC